MKNYYLPFIPSADVNYLYLLAFYDIAEYLEMRQDSLYNWLCGYYDLGKEKQSRLYDIIGTLKE